MSHFGFSVSLRDATDSKPHSFSKCCRLDFFSSTHKTEEFYDEIEPTYQHSEESMDRFQKFGTSVANKDYRERALSP